MLQISLRTLRTKLFEILDYAIEIDGIDRLSLDLGYYWDIPDSLERYNVLNEPRPSLGDAYHDWENIRKGTASERIFLYYYAEILRYISSAPSLQPLPTQCTGGEAEKSREDLFIDQQESTFKSIEQSILQEVAFVMDYFELRFTAGTIRCNSDHSVILKQESFPGRGPGWRDQLCAFIGRQPLRCYEDVGTASIILTFDGGDSITISTRSNAMSGPEGAHLLLDGFLIRVWTD